LNSIDSILNGDRSTTPKNFKNRSAMIEGLLASPVEELRMISLFSGAGGMDLGLEAVGFSSLFVSDIDEHSCRTLEAGKRRAEELKKPFLRGALIQRADVRQLSGKDLLNKIGLKAGDVDLLSGGPPCQAFSVFGKRRGSLDPRGQLLAEYLRLITEVRPRAFVFENVYGLLSIEGGSVFEKLCKTLENPAHGLKYTLSVFRLNAVDFGVPQYRDRVFVIGHLGGATIPSIPPICVPEPVLPGIGMHSYRKVKQALKGLPPMASPYPANHIGRDHSKRIITRYGGMSAGERDAHTRINKLDLERPSFTIIVGSDKGGGKGHIHPTEPREVTPRESARIQTFPDWWSFSGTSRHPIRQVGNAVPPLLAAAVGNEIRHHFFGKPRIPFRAILRLLDQQHLFSEP
jgi:DNA (cytosine-5)-methyltransferase 1